MGGMVRKTKQISDFDKALGSVVRSKRQKLRLSQAAVAEAIGVPMSNYQRREDGRNEISVSELERIATVVKVSRADLVEEALNDYGGIEKLLAEHAKSDTPANVTAEDNVTYMGHVTPPEKIAAKKKREED